MDELAPHAPGDRFDLSMTASVNGTQYISGNWSSLYWPFPDLIAYASCGTTLLPGDVIGAGAVGTPADDLPPPSHKSIRVDTVEHASGHERRCRASPART
ncbi:fumarylacetoacetate hydrolase family protein [Pseudonocardia sp. GCM10023141]|uniref:fumarylacetoacetate hydrolase family protein n=1 Tax=Pseudonocardia sp. GCM10023141 TaxID=3252653 RepID=UPI00361CFD4A